MTPGGDTVEISAMLQFNERVIAHSARHQQQFQFHYIYIYHYTHAIKYLGFRLCVEYHYVSVQYIHFAYIL